MLLCVFIEHASFTVYVSMYVCMYVRVCVCVCVCVCLCVLYVCVCLYKHTSILFIQVYNNNHNK